MFITVIILIHPWQIGKSKVFLRAGQMAELDARRAEVLGNAARTIQRQIHTYIARKEFISLREAAINLQSYLRGNFLDSLKIALVSLFFSVFGISPINALYSFMTLFKSVLYFN